MEKKLTPEQIEQMANEIRQFLLDNEIWIDTAIYFNGKCFTTGYDGVYAYNDPNNLIVLENAEPRKFTEYAGDILTMTFEGPLYSCIHGYGEYSRAFEERIFNGLCNIFDRYGCYYELGNAWNLTLYSDYIEKESDMKYICKDEIEPLILEPEDHTESEWQTILKLFGMGKAERIVVRGYTLEAYGKEKARGGASV